MKQVALVVMFFPLLAFCQGGVTGIRSQRTGVEKFGSVVPIVLGASAFELLLGLRWLVGITPEASVTNSRVMTMVCVLMFSCPIRGEQGRFGWLVGLLLAIVFALYHWPQSPL